MYSHNSIGPERGSSIETKVIDCFPESWREHLSSDREDLSSLTYAVKDLSELVSETAALQYLREALEQYKNDPPSCNLLGDEAAEFDRKAYQLVFTDPKAIYIITRSGYISNPETFTRIWDELQRREEEDFMQEIRSSFRDFTRTVIGKMREVLSQRSSSLLTGKESDEMPGGIFATNSFSRAVRRGQILHSIDKDTESLTGVPRKNPRNP